MSTLNACTMSNPRFSATNCKLRNDIINRRCEIKYGARQKMDEHIFGPAALPRARSTAPVVTWNKSEARRLLERDLATGAIPVCGREMGTRLVYASRPEYATYTLELFTRRLASMRKTAKGQNARRVNDVAAHAHDLALRPQATHNINGVPRWEGSNAERLLKEDITAGLHTQMAPKMLFKTRVEYYQCFTLEKFRGHIAQEVKLRKFRTSYYGR